LTLQAIMPLSAPLPAGHGASCAKGTSRAQGSNRPALDADHFSGGDLMKKIIIALALAGALAPSLAKAQVNIDMSKITCGEVLAMPADDQADFAAFMSGWFAQKVGRTFIDMGLFQKNFNSVMSWCASNKSESVFTGLERAVQAK
jgi:hypothetical protein